MYSTHFDDQNLGASVDFYVREGIGKGDSYIAPDPHFVSSIALFARSFPWSKFELFFARKSMVNLSTKEHLILLRLIALQEVLALSDDALLRWAKHQLFLFSFMQPDFQPKLPTVELLQEFRKNFDQVGLLTPFRKQCQRLIIDHENRLLSINHSENTSNISAGEYPIPNKSTSIRKVDTSKPPVNSNSRCPNCGNSNVITLKPSQEASTLPNISFSKCRFCGNVFRERK